MLDLLLGQGWGWSYQPWYYDVCAQAAASAWKAWWAACGLYAKCMAMGGC